MGDEIDKRFERSFERLGGGELPVDEETKKKIAEKVETEPDRRPVVRQEPKQKP